MATLSFLQRFFEGNCDFMHRTRRAALLDTSVALLDHARLNLTSLGRRLCGNTLTKHRIKRVDRLLGNRHLHRERPAVYAALTRWALAGRHRPVIAIDWSPVESGHRFQMLKAAVTLEGRALTLYEEVHRVEGCSRGRAERIMLKRLAAMVPEGCRPVIVTDAGFHHAWFRLVRQLGWDFVSGAGSPYRGHSRPVS